MNSQNPVSPYQHAHLPAYPLFAKEIHSYLRNIYRVGGGRIVRCHIGGLGDAICMVENSLFPTLLYLHYDPEKRWFVPAVLRDNWDCSVRTVPIVHLRKSAPTCLSWNVPTN